MLRKLMQLVGISCRHGHLSHPFAAASAPNDKASDWETVSQAGGHYVVCLDCGKQFQYDWSTMRVIW